MKKLMLASAAAALLGAGGAAFGQSAECQRGMFAGYTPDPCAPVISSVPQPHPYGWQGAHYPYMEHVLPLVLADGRLLPRGFVTPYAPTRRDRDGDGVRNRHDRYPDDPRYR